MIHARQIKAARALLDWSQEYLATISGLSITTIHNLERGNVSPRHATNNVIRQTFENAGVEFEPKGVKLLDEMIRRFQGPDSCDLFFDDVLQTVREKGGEIVCAFRSSAVMKLACDLKRGSYERLERLSEIAPVKCLVADLTEPLSVNPSFQIRTASKLYIGPISFIEYGNKHALILAESATSVRFAVFPIARMALAYRDHFFSIWKNTLPLPAQPNAQDIRIPA